MRQEPKVERQLCEGVLKNLLGLLILSRLDGGEPISGYDFLPFIHRKSGIEKRISLREITNLLTA